MGSHLDSILIWGRWLKREASSHINFLELKAALLAFQALVPSVKGPHICFGIDNRTAMSHINKLGGTCSQNLSNLANTIMELCPEQKPDNFSHVLSDHKSRIFNDSMELFQLKSSHVQQTVHCKYLYKFCARYDIFVIIIVKKSKLFFFILFLGGFSHHFNIWYKCNK